MPIRITPEQHHSLARRPVVERLAEVLPDHEPSLARMAPPILAAIAADGVKQAHEAGFTDFPATLYFVLLMLRVHPRFHTVGSIKRVIGEMKSEPMAFARRAERLVNTTDEDDWDKAAALGGFEAYYKSLAGTV